MKSIKFCSGEKGPALLLISILISSLYVHPVEHNLHSNNNKKSVSYRQEKSNNRSYQLESRGIPTFREFAEIYVKNYMPAHKKEITILYPGSGGDLAPLNMAIDILDHAEDVNRIQLIYTEIGGLDIFGENISDISWHDGLGNLIEQIKIGLKEYEIDHAVKIAGIRKIENSSWARSDIPGSSVTEFTMNVRFKSEDTMKSIILLLCYNVFENRREFSSKEKKFFDKEYLRSVRRGYWHPDPRYKLNFSPSYFIQDQFDHADILLSNSPGDPFLLVFDYIRALTNIRSPYPKVFLIDWGWDEKYELSRILREEFHYRVDKRGLKNNKFGDCRKEPCKPQIIHVY